MSETLDFKRYNRSKIKLSLIGTAAFWVWAAAWSIWGATVAEPIGGAAVSIGGGALGRWLALTAYALVFLGGYELLTLPLAWYRSFRLEHAFGLSRQTPRAWVVRQLKEWLVGAVLGGVLLGGLYACLWYAGDLWWLWVWIGWLALSVGLAHLFPLVILPLFYPARRIDRAELTERLKGLAAGTSLRIAGVYDLALSKDTNKANAMLAGLGGSRRVYLSDTLLEAFNEDEIAVVFAHELAHHIRGHIWKGLGLSAMISSVLVGILVAILGPHGGEAPFVEAVSALPSAALLVAVVSFVLSPVSCAVLRRFERQCDGDALARTADPAAYRSAMTKLGEMNLADPEPARWVELLFYDHPALAKRIAIAEEGACMPETDGRDERSSPTTA